ncbi:hypothetical protein [Streptomyces sp. NPDC048606]|uniref:hypothetical protein n=1 Tax=Streptomyces sp. NPDC048606 TaxID=3154726 RepID=UPI00342A19C4
MHIPPTVALAVAVGALWWWAVLRLALAPDEAGPVEGAVAVGGWGLGLLPVHCAPWRPVARRRGNAARDAGGAGAGPDGARGEGVAGWRPRGGREVTRASTLPRSGEGSGPS